MHIVHKGIARGEVLGVPVTLSPLCKPFFMQKKSSIFRWWKLANTLCLTQWPSFENYGYAYWCRFQSKCTYLTLFSFNSDDAGLVCSEALSRSFLLGETFLIACNSLLSWLKVPEGVSGKSDCFTLWRDYHVKKKFINLSLVLHVSSPFYFIIFFDLHFTHCIDKYHILYRL